MINIKKQIPQNYDYIISQWQNGELNCTDAASQLDISHYTFRKYRKFSKIELEERKKEYQEKLYGKSDPKEYEKRQELFEEHLFYIDYFMRSENLYDIDDKEDLKQELVIHLWEFTKYYLDHYRKENFKNILHTSLRQSLYHYRVRIYAEKRGKKATEKKEDFEIYKRKIKAPNAFQNLESKIDLEMLFLNAELSKKQVFVVKCYLCGFTNRYIENHFGISKSMVSYHYTQALKKMRRYLEENNNA